VVSELFLNSRVAGDWGHSFGSLKSGSDLKSVIARHRPRFE